MVIVNILEAKNVTKTYTIGGDDICVLDDVSLAVGAGEFVAVMGSSGSGKSTLLSLLSGLDSPSTGRIWVADRDITDLSEDELAPLRNETIGFVFQSFHLVPSLSARENIMFPAELRHDREAQKKAEALLARVGLQARSNNFPHQLSGGEKQRVAICRALINDPKILFADEPTGNLDSKNGESILNLLLDLHQERQTTLVLVTHDLKLAVQERRLRTRRLGGISRGLPPLVTMESLLFQMIGAGFGALTLSLLSGFFFLDNLFAQHLVHKTVLSIAAWLVFATLLWGRRRYGWRGRTAIRWTLSGFAVLVLAYFGSKLVLELVLRR